MVGIASGVPEHYGLSPQLLGRWQRRGWLGRRAEGTGSRYDWWNPDVAAQIDWLKRLRTARHLDQEDADGGWRLRASGASYGFRAEGGRWEPVEDALVITSIGTLAHVGTSWPSVTISTDSHCDEAA